MRVLVFGGRDYTDREFMYEYLDGLHKKHSISLVIQGAARGADRMAGDWARSRGINQLIFPADWGKHGKSAGFIRNKEMRDEGKPDVGVAFPGGRGTSMMKQLLEEKDIPVYDATC